LKILITGSNGLLGQKLVYRLAGKPGYDIIATSKGENRISMKDGYRYQALDITNKAEVMQIVSDVKPDCIINTAAMTNVDACENDKSGCKALNIDAVQYLVDACRPYASHFIHLSTDFVFDGENGPYREDDEPNPLSYYAWSKLESEKIVVGSGLDWPFFEPSLFTV
jgi:dTDP-4-dehydrorhamnose reductase